MSADPRQLLDQLPDDALLPVGYVRQLVAEIEVAGEDRVADLDVQGVAAALGRAPSTVRAWAASGQLSAYKLNGREWRVTREALREYQDRARSRYAAGRTWSRSSRPVDLSSWRSVRAGRE